MNRDEMLATAIERGLAAVWPTQKDREMEYSGHIEGTIASITAAVDPLLDLLFPS